MIADFKPTDGHSISKMEWVTVEGAAADPAAVTVDERLEKTVDGMNVALTVEPKIEAGKELTLKFTLTEGEAKEGISDFEPYLRSIGHVVVLSEDGE
jgi:hypothetical protein